MTVGALLRTISSSELTEWQALFELEMEEAHRRQNGVGKALSPAELRATLAPFVKESKR